MRNILLCFFAVLLLASCKDKVNPETKVLNLHDEVLAIHDEVMPKMGAIHIAKKELKKVLIEIDDDSVKAEINALIVNLENADEGMMIWMNEWKVPENEPKKTAYLNIEKEKITKVKVDMLNSLKKANAYLSKKNKK